MEMGGQRLVTKDFYQRDDVVQIAKDLLGKELVTYIDGELTSGIIIETEAYAGPLDKASHAAGGRYTPRTKTMFEAGGIAYIYLIYGIHHLFNFVTNRKGIPHAVLLRGIIPVQGLEIMQRRRKTKKSKGFTSGPGTAAQALGLSTALNACSLTGPEIWVEHTGIGVKAGDIIARPRIGVDYAGEHALWEWNFSISGELILQR